MVLSGLLGFETEASNDGYTHSNYIDRMKKISALIETVKFFENILCKQITSASMLSVRKTWKYILDTICNWLMGQDN